MPEDAHFVDAEQSHSEDRCVKLCLSFLSCASLYVALVLFFSSSFFLLLLSRECEPSEGIALLQHCIEPVNESGGLLLPCLPISQLPSLPSLPSFLHSLLFFLPSFFSSSSPPMCVQGLEQCEFLEKLDLTANFLDDLISLESLRGNEHLHEL